MNIFSVNFYFRWKEDDDIFDDDLPVEPLEAPDDGPDVFEGEARGSEWLAEYVLWKKNEEK